MRFRMIDTRELLLLLVDKYFFSLSLSPRERTHVASAARLENVIPPLLLFVYINFTRSIIYRDNSFPYIFVTSKMHRFFRIVLYEAKTRNEGASIYKR